MDPYGVPRNSVGDCPAAELAREIHAHGLRLLLLGYLAGVLSAGFAALLATELAAMTGAQRGALPPPPLAGSYGTILADPPWRMLLWSDRGRDRCPDGPRAYYKTLLTPDIAALPVASWGARDCRLFLWTTDCHLPQALALGAAWGFRYSTIAVTWAKQTKAGRTWQFAGGKATRKATELCRCSCADACNAGRPACASVVAPVRDHSRKPDETYAGSSSWSTAPTSRCSRASGGPGGMPGATRCRT